MSHMKPFFTILVIVIILLGFFFIINRTPAELNLPQTTTTEEYVRAHISTLSPIAATLGGTFYVTDIQAGNGNGIVKYEDGHMAYVADFTYKIDTNGNPNIQTFTVRK